jgi:UMF1 family MFS transporter
MTRSHQHPPGIERWLEKAALHRPDLRAWAIYDWANSSFWATVIQIFPIYFISTVCVGMPAAVANSRYAFATTLALSIVAVISPILGAVADYAGAKKKFMAVFIAVGVPATAAMFLIEPGEWRFALLVYIVGNIGVAGSLVFYDSLLPHVARADEMDRLSTAGFALGYLGSGLLMALNLAWIRWPHWFGIPDTDAAVRLSLLSAAIWWSVFSLPLFLRVPEPTRRLEHDERAGLNPMRVGFMRLFETLRELKRYRQAFVFLLAFLIYNDGIGTIIRMAAPYGTEIGIAPSALVGAILIVQFVGVPFAFLFGRIARKIGAKRAIFIGLAVYLIITVLAFRMRTAGEFFVLAVLVGMVQGGTQALSRSLFASMIPRHKSAEFFGFFGVFEKFAGIIGPLVFGLIIVFTGSSRNAILAVVSFFVLGGLLLACVDVSAGRQAARQAEERLLGQGSA